MFGDIDLQEHKDWVDRVCSEVDVASIEPLWRDNPKEVLKGVVDGPRRIEIIKIRQEI